MANQCCCLLPCSVFKLTVRFCGEFIYLFYLLCIHMQSTLVTLVVSMIFNTIETTASISVALPSVAHSFQCHCLNVLQIAFFVFVKMFPLKMLSVRLLSLGLGFLSGPLSVFVIFLIIVGILFLKF